MANNCLRLIPLLFIFLNTYIIADAKGVEIPPCSTKVLTVSSTGNDKLIAQRIAFFNAVGMGMTSSGLNGMIDSLAPLTRLMESLELSLGLNLEKSKGRMIPGFGPLKKPEFKNSIAGNPRCKYARVNPHELFCVGMLWEDYNEDKRKNMFFGVSLKQMNGGWKCEGSVISEADEAKIIPTTESQKKEISKKMDFNPRATIEDLSATNPFRIWGESNRCLWDETFAVVKNQCGTSKSATQVTQAGTREIKVTGKGPADSKTIVTECGFIIGTFKSVDEIAFAEPVKAGEMSRPFDAPKSTLIYPTRITITNTIDDRKAFEAYVYMSSFGDLKCLR